MGPDGNVYVGDNTQNTIFRNDGSTGAPLPAPGQTGAIFVNASSTASSGSDYFAFGPDGNIYLGNTPNQILEYQGPAGASPGAYIGVFVTLSNDAPHPVTGVNNLAFGPDGNLYVNGFSANNFGQIYRYDGTTGAPLPGPGQTGAIFVPYGSGGLINARTIIFDPDGTNMYVAAPETGTTYPPLIGALANTQARSCATRGRMGPILGPMSRPISLRDRPDCIWRLRSRVTLRETCMSPTGTPPTSPASRPARRRRFRSRSTPPAPVR